jgi:hypothetical protein
MSANARVFSTDDQVAFARLSGDYNPIHLDAVAARRLLFGQPVVHGMHALLWAIDVWLGESNVPVRLKTLKARFRASIPLNANVEVVTRSEDSKQVNFDLLCDEVKVLTASSSFDLEPKDQMRVSPEIPPCESCRNRTAVELQSAAGLVPLCFEPEMGGHLFPHAARHLATDQLAMLLATTRVVGMEAPGLHSILGGLDLQESSLQADSSETLALRYQTDNYDERVSRLELRLDAPGLAGKVTAFLRPEPHRQATVASLRSLVNRDEFQGEQALVIGGSRGLGEVVVKLLAAGGAEVKFTYHRGSTDADRLISELAADACAVSCFSYDVLQEPVRLPEVLGRWSPTLLCYFATPFISAATPRRFSPRRFQDFCDYYVGGFLNAFHAARALGPGLKNVLYPSTVFIDELPLNMGEYAAAKSAAETLCRFLEKAYPETRIHCPRLPKLSTDQTASLIPTDVPDPAPTLLAILREMRAR